MIFEFTEYSLGHGAISPTWQDILGILIDENRLLVVVSHEADGKEWIYSLLDETESSKVNEWLYANSSGIEYFLKMPIM